MTISLIAVIGKNRELGLSNKLLWNIPEDMARFKKITDKHAVIMGSKTYQSIGKSLPGRVNIIISRNKNYIAPGCLIASSIDNAIKIAKQNSNHDEIFVIGGASIYRQFMPKANKLYITKVDDAPKADAYFPDYSEFKNILLKEKHNNGDKKFTFYELTR